MLPLLAALLVTSAAVEQSAPVREGYATMDDGVRLFYRVVGASTDAIVVPVAVLTSPHFDALAKNRLVVYYDPRGRGRSDVGDLAKVSLKRSLQDLEALREHLKLARIALVGFSGYGLEFALYALEHPDRVTHLVQLAPVPPRLSPWMDGRGAGIEQRMDKTANAKYERLDKAGEGSGEARCRAYQQALAPAFSAHPERMDVAALCVNRNEWPERQRELWAAFMPSLTGIDVRSRVPELRMPRLVIWPERDLIPLEGVKEWLVGGAPAKLLTVPDADHSAFIDRPEMVIRAIDEFVRPDARGR